MFKIISTDEFTLKIFDEYPVWSEHYDYYEIEEIVSWGIDRKWLLDEIDKKHTGNDHCYYPLLKTNPFPARMRIYIKAHITTKSGKAFSGYIINEDAYVICLFVNGEEIGFSANLSQKGQIDSIKRLEELTKSKYSSLFPLKYETEFFSSSGKKIDGLFRLKKYPHLLNKIFYFVRSRIFPYSSKKYWKC